MARGMARLRAGVLVRRRVRLYEGKGGGGSGSRGGCARALVRIVFCWRGMSSGSKRGRASYRCGGRISKGTEDKGTIASKAD